MIDWHEYKDDALLTPFRFHAEHHRYKPAPPRNSAFQMADVDGTGFMAGIVLGSRQHNYTDMIYHTGGMSILIDGENDPHVIRGTNMEDDFGFSWGFHVKNTRWIGSPYHKWGASRSGRCNLPFLRAQPDCLRLVNLLPLWFSRRRY